MHIFIIVIREMHFKEEQVYELEPGKPRTLEELVQLYVEITAAWSIWNDVGPDSFE